MPRQGAPERIQENQAQNLEQILRCLLKLRGAAMKKIAASLDAVQTSGFAKIFCALTMWRKSCCVSKVGGKTPLLRVEDLDNMHMVTEATLC